MTFKEYLAERRAGYDAQGDFVRLALSDPALPDISSLQDLMAYAERRSDYHGVEAGRAVWEDYEAKLREAARLAKKR